jgi:hypothetical protein
VEVAIEVKKQAHAYKKNSGLNLWNMKQKAYRKDTKLINDPVHMQPVSLCARILWKSLHVRIRWIPGFFNDYIE